MPESDDFPESAALLNDDAERLRVLDRSVQASVNGVLITDPRQDDNPIVYCNPAFERITGYSRNEILGRNCRFLQGQDREQRKLVAIRESVTNGSAITAVLRNYRKDGTLFWNELTISPVHNEQGTITHFVGIQNDITARVLAEQALIEKEQHLRSITDALPVLITYVDPDFVVQFRNAAFDDWFGLVDNRSHCAFPELVQQTWEQEWSDHFHRALEGERVEFESQLSHRSMGQRSLQVILVPERGQSVIQGLHCLLIDITDRLKLQARTAHERRIADQLDRLTTREREVYELLILGTSNKNIATKLGIGLRTVERRRREVLDKLEVKTLADLLKQLANIRHDDDA